MANEGQAIAVNEKAHQAMLKHLENTRHSVRDKAIYLLTYRAGLRIGSVAGLLLSDVVEKGGEVRKVVILRKDNNKSRKTISVYINHPELQEALKDWVKYRSEKKFTPLFYSQKGTAFSANSLCQVMLKHYNNAGLEGYSSHSGRRGALSSWIKAGIDIVAVSKLAGHSSLNTTMRYIHHDQEEIMDAIEKI